MKLLTLASGTILVLGLSITAYAENAAQVELEHQIKTPSSIESPKQDMSAMKAAGKCGAGQSTTRTTFKPTTKSKADVELEHQIKTPSNTESPRQDMSAMKAAGKCGTGQSTTRTTFKPTKKSKADLTLERQIDTPSSVESPK